MSASVDQDWLNDVYNNTFRDLSPAPEPSPVSTRTDTPLPNSDSDSDNNDSDSDNESDAEPIAEEPWVVYNGFAYPAPHIESAQDLPNEPFRPAPPSPPALSPPAKTPPRTTRATVFTEYDSDADAEGESDTPSDDEYMPSPLSSPRKRPSPLPARKRPSPTPLASPSPKRARPAPASRNVQARPRAASTFECATCGWRQTNKRMPDFQRHLRTHERPAANEHARGWWCKGVRVEDAPPGVGEPYMFLGVLRVGGCVRSFSRRDALKRHLDNANVPCLGTCGRD